MSLSKTSLQNNSETRESETENIIFNRVKPRERFIFSEQRQKHNKNKDNNKQIIIKRFIY